MIQIPKPCHADWNEMTPTQQGSFCGSCSKEVIDFTQMSDKEVKNYFLYAAKGKTCGRFRTEQVDRIRISLPNNIFLQKIAGWKKFMAVVMLAFGSMLFGCDVGVDTHMVGKIEQVKTEKTRLTGDTTFTDLNEATMGMIAMPPDTITPVTGTKCKSPIIVEDKKKYQPLMGDVAIIPDTVIKPTVDTTSYTKMGEIALPLVKKNKPASDTNKCKDTGYY